MSLDEAIFGAEVRPHLVHEAVRAEMAAARAGTRGAKSRGLVAGGRAKPWRQKGTGRARQGTTRAPQWVGGGVAFPPMMRDFSFKVNRKERRAAMRIALSAHVDEGTLAVFDGEAFDAPSTKAGASFLETFGKELPVVIVLTDDEQAADQVVPQPLARSDQRAGGPGGVGDRLGAHAARLGEGAAGGRGARREGGGVSLHPNESPARSDRVGEELQPDRRPQVHVPRARRRAQDADPPGRRAALRGPRQAVNIIKVQPKPEAPQLPRGTRPGWKKAIVQVREGESIPIFEGAQV